MRALPLACGLAVSIACQASSAAEQKGSPDVVIGFREERDLFDARTSDGADMSHYDGLPNKALASIENTFQRRAAASLLSSRNGVLPTAEYTPAADSGDFDLVTWLVIMEAQS